jgi:hypothetical protein
VNARPTNSRHVRRAQREADAVTVADFKRREEQAGKPRDREVRDTLAKQAIEATMPERERIVARAEAHAAHALDRAAEKRQAKAEKRRRHAGGARG